MTKRALLLTPVAEAIAIPVVAMVAGVWCAYVLWSDASFAASGGPARWLDEMLSFPALLFARPFGWLGVSLVLSPSVYRRLTRRAPADHPAYSGYAYVECPVCKHVVPMSYERCPLCGTELFAPWTNASREA